MLQYVAFWTEHALGVEFISGNSECCLEKICVRMHTHMHTDMHMHHQPCSLKFGILYT